LSILQFAMHRPSGSAFKENAQTASPLLSGRPDQYSIPRFQKRPRSLKRKSTATAAARLNHRFEDNTMTSDEPEDADKTPREQRQRRIRIFVGLCMLMLGAPPLLNALGNPRLQALHGPDLLGLIASGMVIGFGLGLLLSQIMFRGG
jgi:hypothetical protein